MREMQNRMTIVFCVKPPISSVLLWIKGASVKFSGGGGSVGLAPALYSSLHIEQE